MTDILMPALSPTMESGTLTRWFVERGTTVKAGDKIAEIETDKASMDVEASEDGVIAELLVAAGVEGVKVNAPIARMTASEAFNPKSREPLQLLSPSVRRIVAEASIDASDLVGTGRDGRPTKGDALAFLDRASDPSAHAQPAASRLAGRLAAASGIDLNQITGSGAGGRVLKADIEASQPNALRRSAGPAQADGPARAGTISEPADQQESPDAYVLTPLSGMRRTIARRMTEAARDIPHISLSIDVELDALFAARKAVNTALAGRGAKVTLNDMMIKAAAHALGKVPEVNASFRSDGIALHRNADISVAVAIAGGLITPIVRAAETKGVGTIAAEMVDLAERARIGKLKPEEFQGGTFSISNLGMFGTKAFNSIINLPQGAILSVGAAEPRPVVREAAIEVATVCTLTLTCDHRVIDGATAAQFLQALRGVLTEPLLMMA